jgi:hypothetical protein
MNAGLAAYATARIDEELAMIGNGHRLLSPYCWGSSC